MNHLEKAFWRFHQENPHIYLLFDRFARQVLAAGYRRYSSDAVLHRIRWHTHIVARDPRLHFTNNHSPYYARLWMSQYPQHAGLFELRSISDGSDGTDTPPDPEDEPAEGEDPPAHPAGEGHARRPAASIETHHTV